MKYRTEKHSLLMAYKAAQESGKEVISVKEGAVRFDYSAVRQPIGIPIIQKGEPMNWSIPTMSLKEIELAVKTGQALDERTADMTFALNEIATTPKRCDAAAN